MTSGMGRAHPASLMSAVVVTALSLSVGNVSSVTAQTGTPLRSRAASIDPELRSQPAPAAIPGQVTAGREALPDPTTDDAVAEQARRDGVDVDAVRQAVSRRMTADDPVRVDATVGPERPVAHVPPYRVPAVAAERPAVAFDGTNYLVAWNDGRDPSGGGRRIFAARVARDGTVLDDVGIRLSDGATSFSGPSVAFDGTNFLVVWAQEAYDANPGIFGNRVSRSGAVLDGTGFQIDDTGTWEPPRVAFDGTNYLVVWSGAYGKRVDPAGTVLDPEPISMSARPSFRGQVAVSFDGSNYLVVWTDTLTGGSAPSEVLGTRVSPAGSVLDPAGIAISAAPGSQPALGFDGTNYLVVWSGVSDPALGIDIRGTRVSPAGIVLDPGGLRISTNSWEDTVPAVAFDGTNYLVVWVNPDQYYEGVVGARVSPAGTVLDPAGLFIPTAAANEYYPPALAFDGTNYLVTAGSDIWEQLLHGQQVDRDGVPLHDTAFVIATAAPDEADPAVGFDGTNYLVTFSRSGDVYGARVGRNGRILDGTGFRIGYGVDPAIAFDGTNFLVVWTSPVSPSYVNAARVSPDGTVLDPDGLGVSGLAASRPAVAFNGSEFVVVWLQYSRYCSCGTGSVVLGARVTSAGQVLPSDNVPIADDVAGAPAVASDGTNSLVVWADGPDLYSTDIYGTRVNRSLEVLDGAGIPISVAPARQADAAVAYDGTRYLVAWTDMRSSPDGYTDIYAARVGRSGVVRDPDGIPVSTAPDSQSLPSVSANGRFFVVWRDQREGYRNVNVHGARVSGAGQVFDPDGVPIATARSWEEGAAVTAGPGRRYAVVYQRYAESPGASDRVFFRTIAPK